MTIKIEPVTAERIKTMRRELTAFEKAYGVPSNHLASAFTTTAGHLRETEDYRRWRFLWSVWQRRQRAAHLLAPGPVKKR